LTVAERSIGASYANRPVRVVAESGKGTVEDTALCPIAFYTCHYPVKSQSVGQEHCTDRVAEIRNKMLSYLHLQEQNMETNTRLDQVIVILCIICNFKM